MPTTAIFGAGAMGEALLSGLLRSGRDPQSIVAADKRADHAAHVGERYGVRVLGNPEAAAAADTALLVVKPADVDGLLAEISAHLRPRTLVVSLAAGVPTAYVESRLPSGSPVVRAMPNTASLVGEGMAALSPGRHCASEHLAEATEILASCGRVVVVPERHQDVVTALSGSGPAYLFYVAEAMTDAGVLLGLPRATVSELVAQTLYGAATMLRETGERPTVLREQVSSPGGTTVAALRQLDEHAVRAAFLAAVEAAAQRSTALAAELS